MKSKIIALLCSAICLAGLICLGTGCEPQQVKKGILKLNLTDAPADYEEVFITFTRISVHRSECIDNATDNCTDNTTDNSSLTALFKNNGKGKDNQTDDNSTDGDDDGSDGDDDNSTDNATDDSGWIVISTDEQGFDLLKLQNGKFDLLAEASLDAGKYTQIRLKITDALDNNSEPKTYVKVDGVKYPLVVPSGTRSGLKLTHPFTITGDNETVLYLDFDAEKSVNQTGSGIYKLKPTIKVLTEPPAVQ